MKINDKDYWTEYYNNAKLLQSPSPFAKYLVGQNFLNDSHTLLELGCGNGRDARYFANNSLKVIAIDQCENTTKLLNKIDNIDSYSADFTNLSDLFEKRMSIDIIYSRFTIHSINEKGENRTIKWTYDNLIVGGFFCMEARTIKDPLFGKGVDKGNNIWFYNNHHRRFIDAVVFRSKLETLGFKINYFEEKNGFAKYKNEDPIVLRLIVTR